MAAGDAQRARDGADAFSLEEVKPRVAMATSPAPRRSAELRPRAPSKRHVNRLRLQDLAALLASLGLARRYSDGVTEVLNPLRVWQN